MGCHPNGPSLDNIGRPLDANLPFLFKFLSVAKSLSIQVHPTKEHAEQLHKANPTAYTDANHKPEMAIALTRVSLLYGFRVDWSRVLNQYLEIPHKATLCELVEYLLTAYDLNRVYDKILDRVGFNPLTPTDELFVRLSEQHPGDKGALLAMFMNVVELEPGQAVSIGPNIPHAYLSGDLVECMACSDNVIRVGLTNKFKDTNALLSCVSYETGLPRVQPVTSYYESGFVEFDVANLFIQNSKTISTNDGQLIIAVMSGTGHISTDDFEYMLKPCIVLYVPPCKKLTITATDPLNIWMAIAGTNFTNLFS
jgi:mannose-6-phosphate isomerase